MANVKLAQWRAGRTEELTLPSGLTITVKRIGLLDLVGSGELPKPLLGMVDQVMRAGGVVTVEAAELAQYLTLITAAVRLAIIDPPVADVGDDEHLGIDELTADDKLAIFNWMNAPAKAVTPFPPESGGAVAAGSGGEAVREPAVKPFED